MSDYFHDIKIQEIKIDHRKRELIISLQCYRDWETARTGSLDDMQFTYILRFTGVYGFRSVTKLQCTDYINGRFKQTAWLNEQQRRTKRRLYQFRIGLADGYIDLLFCRFSIRKAIGRISYCDINLQLLYANGAKDLSLQCRSVIGGAASSDAKIYAAWLLGKYGTKEDLLLLWDTFRAEKERKEYDQGSDDPMKYRNLLDAIEQLGKNEQ